jgi:glutaredoxin
MYGTFWCPYCNRQKELFGAAVDRLQLIECDPKGANAQPDACAKANVSSYPSWEVNGQIYRGMQSLEELAALSGYRGPTQFE